MKAIALLWLTASSALASVDPVINDIASMRPFPAIEAPRIPTNCTDSRDPKYLMLFSRGENGRAKLVGIIIVHPPCG
ncbi:hypothetical protein JJB09_17080 [Rhizobium sp. KVB221]|uniref:Uncharacterized protein n=1 Tax=Rhizobium setariae TaxID=2801340 RepID=A0A936YNI9_9HYPH|nr:hypothetical protein [Rhizobium setariae]MBL0373738.1 hypothetical protein [Rhizobium setariae]